MRGRKKIRLPGMVKFSLSSFSSFLVDYLLFSAGIFVCGEKPAAVLACNVLARLVSGTWNYLMNCRFVFHTGPAKKTAVKYLGLAACILAANNCILEFLTICCGLKAYPAKLITELTLFVMSWLVQRFMIFGKHGKE